MLSIRLEAIASLVDKCQVIADIGTDHGYLPIALVKKNIVKKAYAMDINIGPLETAKKNIDKAKLKGTVLTLQSNGLEKLPEEVDSIVIAGMGGMLIGSILEEGRTRLKTINTLIVSPHLDEDHLRMKLHELGFKIDQEIMVLDQGKYYPIIKCTQGFEFYSVLEYKYGKCLMKDGSPIFKDYIQKQHEKISKVIKQLRQKPSDNTKQRLLTLETDLKELVELEGKL